MPLQVGKVYRLPETVCHITPSLLLTQQPAANQVQVELAFLGAKMLFYQLGVVS